jgi:hypothetical protein
MTMMTRTEWRLAIAAILGAVYLVAWLAVTMPAPRPAPPSPVVRRAAPTRPVPAPRRVRVRTRSS